MRILQVVPTYLPAVRYGGPIRSVHGLCRALVSLGHEVQVFTTNVDGPKNSPVPLDRLVRLDGVQVRYFPVPWLRRLYYAPTMRQRLMEEIATFDLIHLHSVFLWPTWAAARAARTQNIPYVLSPRGMLDAALIRRKGRWRKWAWIHLIERYNLAQAAAIHVTAQRELRELAALGLDLAPIIRIPNGIDFPSMEKLIAPPWLSKIPKPFVLYLGRINWKKGIDRLIRAMTQVPQVPLVIAGNDEEQYQPVLERLAQSLGIADRVHFVGSVDEEKWSLYREAAVFALPSQSENFGIVVLEAMAMDCPVVVTEEVGASEIVEKYRAGIVLPPSEQKDLDLSRAIHTLLQEDKSAGERGRKAMESHYSWKKIAEQMEDAYRRIIARS